MTLIEPKFINMRIPTVLQMLLLFFVFSMLPANAQSGEGIWRKTIIVTTLDGTTMEYFIDTDTKVKIKEPYLVIETEGVVLNYELEKMVQVRYGKKSNSTGINNAISDDQPFKWEDETIFFAHLSKNTLIEVFTADGKLIMSHRYTGEAQLPLNSLIDGVYLVKINGATYKILKR